MPARSRRSVADRVADLRAAYDALSETTKRRIAGLVAEHSIMTSRAGLVSPISTRSSAG